jgi:hypothetical protein
MSLQQRSGGGSNFDDIIHIEGRTDSIDNDDAAGLSVTFLTKEGRDGIIRAAGKYEVSPAEITQIIKNKPNPWA